MIVIGTNGSGKSTLLNAVAGTFIVDAGRSRRRPNDDPLAGAPAGRNRRPGLPEPVQRHGADDVDCRESGARVPARQTRGLGWALNRAAPRAGCAIASARSTWASKIGSTTRSGRLSGGQRQALTLLMASWLKPELLLLDEHTAALDPKSADQVIRLTHEIISATSLTTLMVTHSMHQAVNLGDRIVMMHSGPGPARPSGQRAGEGAP